MVLVVVLVGFCVGFLVGLLVESFVGLDDGRFLFSLEQESFLELMLIFLLDLELEIW